MYTKSHCKAGIVTFIKDYEQNCSGVVELVTLHQRRGGQQNATDIP